MEKQTAKEKAEELVDKMFDKHTAKECALIAVGEIYKLDLKVGQYLDEEDDKDNYYSYWEDVKREIERL
jgi:hypothetical protein